MPGFWIWILATVIFLLLILVQVIVRSKRPVLKTIQSMALGVAALIVVNIAGIFTGVVLPVSFLSLGVSAVAGIPGVTMMLVLNMML